MIPGFIPYSIHDPNFPGRACAIAKQEDYLRTTLEQYKNKSVDIFWLNSLVPKTITRCEMQRLQNHIFSMQAMNDTLGGDKGVFLVEDTAHFTKSTESLRYFIENARSITNDSWDILVLGAERLYGTKPLSHRCERVSEFKNPYALYIRRYCIPSIIKIFMESIASGIAPTLDELYNNAIKHYGFSVIGPWKSDAFISHI